MATRPEPSNRSTGRWRRIPTTRSPLPGSANSIRTSAKPTGPRRCFNVHTREKWLEPRVPQLSEIPSPPAGNGGPPVMFGSNVPTIPFPTANPTQSTLAPRPNDDPAHPFN